MRTVNVKFVNFWPGFHEISWFNYWKKIYQHPKINWQLHTDNDPDVLVSSVFGSINEIKLFKCKKILYTRENLNYQHYNQFQSNLSLFDLVIGFNDQDNQINIPWYYELFNLYELDFNKSYIPQNIYRKNLCLISRNPHPLRLALLKSFESNKISVDCPSVVGNNMKIEINNKIEFIQDYYFNICPENSYEQGYITEKLFDCCVAGCVPIYYGCERLNDGFYNKNRILHIKKDLSNYDQIIDQVINLLNNKHQLIEFIKQNPFTDSYQQYIDTVQQKIHTNLERLFL